MKKLSKESKSSLTHTIIYGALGFTCIIIACEMTIHITSKEIISDALLIIGGIFVGGFLAMLTILKIH